MRPKSDGLQLSRPAELKAKAEAARGYEFIYSGDDAALFV